MSINYFKGKKEHYIFCDICGQACYDSEARRLSSVTGRGGLIVCPKDADAIDFGLIPYTIPNERIVPWVRINHTNVTNGAAPADPETSILLGV